MSDQFEIKKYNVRYFVKVLIKRFDHFLKEIDYTRLVWFYWFYINNISKFFNPVKCPHCYSEFRPKSLTINWHEFPKLDKPESITREFRYLMKKDEEFVGKRPERTEIASMTQEERYRQFYWKEGKGDNV